MAEQKRDYYEVLGVEDSMISLVTLHLTVEQAAPELVDLIFQAWILAICLAIFSAISLAAVPEEAHPMDR